MEISPESPKDMKAYFSRDAIALLNGINTLSDVQMRMSEVGLNLNFEDETAKNPLNSAGLARRRIESLVILDFARQILERNENAFYWRFEGDIDLKHIQSLERQGDKMIVVPSYEVTDSDIYRKPAAYCWTATNYLAAFIRR